MNFLCNWSRLGVEPEELSDIAVDREVCQVLLGLLPPRPSPEEKRAAAPATLPRGKAGVKMNGKITIRSSIHDNALIKSSFSLIQLLNFVFIATRAACLPQSACSNFMLCTTW